MKAQAAHLKAEAGHRRRAPRSTRNWDPLVEAAAVTLLVLLAFFLVVA